MLQGCSHHGGGAFRAQGARAVTTIHKGVHLLSHHIGALTDAPGKQVREFEQRRANFVYAGAAKVFARHRLHSMPTSRLLRQQIHHPAQRLQLTHSAITIPRSVCRFTT